MTNSHTQCSEKRKKKLKPLLLWLQTGQIRLLLPFVLKIIPEDPVEAVIHKEQSEAFKEERSKPNYYREKCENPLPKIARIDKQSQ